MNIVNLLGQRENINFKSRNIIFSDYNTIKLEINYQIRKKRFPCPRDLKSILNDGLSQREKPKYQSKLDLMRWI